MDAFGVILIDIRRPSVPLAALPHHDSYVNNVSWAPHSRNLLLGGTSDGMALVWDIKDTQGTQEEAAVVRPRTNPVSSFSRGQEVYQALWFPSQPDCMALSFARQVE